MSSYSSLIFTVKLQGCLRSSLTRPFGSEQEQLAASENSTLTLPREDKRLSIRGQD
jgi:hypothetical protein